MTSCNAQVSLFYFVLTEYFDVEHEQVQDCQMWIPELDLFESDRSVIESNEWLNDNIVCGNETS